MAAQSPSAIRSVHRVRGLRLPRSINCTRPADAPRRAPEGSPAGGATDARFAQIMTSLLKHLHAFVREVELTEAEWLAGIQFLTATGQKCDDKRQEYILLSDTLGLSMLTVAMNNDKPEGCTEATVFGPFHVEGAPHYANGDDVANGAKGEPCVVHGTVRGL